MAKRLVNRFTLEQMEVARRDDKSPAQIAKLVTLVMSTSAQTTTTVKEVALEKLLHLRSQRKDVGNAYVFAAKSGIEQLELLGLRGLSQHADAAIDEIAFLESRFLVHDCGPAGEAIVRALLSPTWTLHRYDIFLAQCLASKHERVSNRALGVVPVDPWFFTTKVGLKHFDRWIAARQTRRPQGATTLTEYAILEAASKDGPADRRENALRAIGYSTFDPKVAIRLLRESAEIGQDSEGLRGMALASIGLQGHHAASEIDFLARFYNGGASNLRRAAGMSLARIAADHRSRNVRIRFPYCLCSNDTARWQDAVLGRLLESDDGALRGFAAGRILLNASDFAALQGRLEWLATNADDTNGCLYRDVAEMVKDMTS